MKQEEMETNREVKEDGEKRDVRRGGYEERGKKEKK
jgi:hypothetical protein